MKNHKPVSLVIAFDAALSDDVICDQELALLTDYLPELLKEISWQTADKEL